MSELGVISYDFAWRYSDPEYTGDMPGHTSAVSSPHQNKQQSSNKHMLGNEWFFIFIGRILHFIYRNGCAKEVSKKNQGWKE